MIYLTGGTRWWLWLVVTLQIVIALTTTTIIAEGCEVQGCECHDESLFMSCHSRDLNSLILPRDLLGLELTTVNSASVDSDFLINSGSLVNLTWTASGIRVLQEGTFAGATSLVRLNLGDNQLTLLPGDVLQPLKQLRHLNLTGNKLNGLAKALFQGPESLEEVYLSRNFIPIVPYQAFASLKALRLLDLSENLLVSLPDHSFKPNRQLRELRLSSNRLTKLPSRLFSGLRLLTTLELNDNDIDSVPLGFFADNPALRRLDLSGNPIVRLTNIAFLGLGNLQWLSLSRTSITLLPRHVWQPLLKLEVLILHGMKLKVLRNGDLEGLENLKTLVVSNSELREIRSGTLRDAPRLRRIDLSDNDLAFLPANLAQLAHLEELNLRGNPWACDCRMFWFIKWTETRAELRAAFDSGLKCAHEENVDPLQALRYLNCSSPTLISVTPKKLHLMYHPVVLECEFNGNPVPSITWVTPKLKVLHWNPDPSFPDAFFGSHPQEHDGRGHSVDDSRIRVLDNGSLYIESLLRRDIGVYKCFASNPIANATVYTTVLMDPVTYHRIKILSIVVGAACAAGFLILTLLVQLLRCLLVK